MKARKAKIDRVSMERASNQAKRIIEAQLARAVKLTDDSEKARRLANNLCMCCFYVHGTRMGGAAMTNRDCGICDQDMLFGSTATDVICPPCATKHELCKQCGSDINLRVRRKDYSWEVQE